MIKLVTISRISKEKGFERMLQMERLLLASGVPFIWDCFGDTSTAYGRKVVPKFKRVKFKGVTSTPLEVMKQYNYLVQLSDTEGFPYSIYEAMQQKLPVIATDFPSIHEMIEDGVNGYILDMDLNNFDSNKIQTVPVITSFTEKSTEQDWIKLIKMTKKRNPAVKPAAGATRGPRRTQTPKAPEKKNEVQVIVTRRYHDTVLDKVFDEGDRHMVSAERSNQLEKAKVAAKA